MMTARWPHTGAILAGGESRRMGRLKESVPLPDGRPMIAHILAVLGIVCRQVTIVGACRGYDIPAEIRHLPDQHPGNGPLAGLETLFASQLDDRYLVVACDQPLLTPELLDRLIREGSDGVSLFHTGHPDDFFPFPGIYPIHLLPRVHEALAQGQRSMKRLLARVAVTQLTLTSDDALRLRSFNTPEDLAAFP